MARVLDLGGHYDAYNFSPTPEEADIKELSGDWERVYMALVTSWAKLARDNPDFVQELKKAASSSSFEINLPSLDFAEEADELEEAAQKG